MAEELWRECANWLVRCQVIPPDHRVTWKHAQVIDLVNTIRDGVLLNHLLNNLEPGCVDLKELNLRPQMSQVLHTLSKLSNCSRAQKPGIAGFSSPNHIDAHDYYNDDIYRNLEDLANEIDGYEDSCYEAVYTSVQIPDEDIYEDLCSFQQNSKNSLVLAPPLEKRDYCIKELIETEKNYIVVLNMIIRNFITPLKQILSAEDRKNMFLSIKELSEIHAGFHNELIKAHSGSARFSQCFLNWRDKFVIYGDYCSNLPRAQELVDELCTKNELVKQTILGCQTEANEGKFKLRDLLSVPMQRVLKYHLLLKELIHNTPATHEDYSGLEKSLECMLDIAQYVNEVKRDNETLQIIHDIQASITDLSMPKDLELKDYGRLLKDGELKIRSHSENNKLKNRYVFVFDKVMLMCKSTRGEQYSYKEALGLAEYVIEDIPLTKSHSRDKWNFTWFLVHREQKQAYTMYAKTEDIKTKWIEAIFKAFDTIHPTQAKSSDHLFEMHTFEKVRSCDSCERLLRGAFYQGYLCPACNVAVHKTCITSVRSCGAPNLPPRINDKAVAASASNQSVKRHPISYCVARRSSNLAKAGFISFQEGDEIHILKKLSLIKWEGRVSRTGQEGFFYSQYVEEQPLLHSQPKRMSYEVPPPVSPALRSPSSNQQVQPFAFPYVNLSLDEYPWYAGKMDKDTAAVQLDKLPDGTFLVRISERQNGIYAISMKHENKVKHMRVQMEFNVHGQNLFYLSESKYFKSIVELVKWYQEKTLADSFTGLDISLTTPFKNVNEESAALLGYAVANFEFAGTAANMLTLKKGDIISILCKRGGDKGWWKGQLNAKVGFFPVTYVSELVEEEL
uniref:Protein vav n=1 Tax=Strigamia maritima TaxID=126957 RepID=T1IVA4_STRMM